MPKVVIDSHPASLDASSMDSFKGICEAVSRILLDKGRAIHQCKLDGQLVENPQEVEKKGLSQVSTVEIISLPLKEVLIQNIQHQILEIKRLEQVTEALVTDCLLAEPQEIVNQWTQICETTKARLGFIPTLAPILKEEELEVRVEPLLGQLGALMKAAGDSFSTADVVTFSDVLENQYLPWLQKFKTLLQNALSEVESYKE
jgi:hypothetical protein